MQVTEVKRLQCGQQANPIREPLIQNRLARLGSKLASFPQNFCVSSFIPQGLEAPQSQPSAQGFCDRILKQWPPPKDEIYYVAGNVVGQLGLLLSQKRVPEPQGLIVAMNELGWKSRPYFMAFVKCFVCNGIRVSVPEEQWSNLGERSLTDSLRRWAKVIFHPEGEEKTQEYIQCCQELIRQESHKSGSQGVMPELMKYWAVQGMSSECLMAFLIATVQWSAVDCPWKTYFSTFDDTSSFWQVWRDKHPGHFDDFNGLMTRSLPDGRCFFLALTEAFSGRCEHRSNQQELLSLLMAKGVNLDTEVSPGRVLRDELARRE